MRQLIILLNGPLGVGKSTLAEALSESMDQCVMLDGDQLIAANPPHPDELEHLHSTLALLIAHHRRFGYRHFVIPHFWRSLTELDDLRRRLTGFDEDVTSQVFLLTLPIEENLRRIQIRQSARALDELEFELQTVAKEREILARSERAELGEPFDVSAPPVELVAKLLRRLKVR